MAFSTVYQWPLAVQGGTVPPSTAQAVNLVSGTITWLDADLTALVTHNFALSLALQTALLPIVSRETDPSNAGTVNPVVTVTKTSGNTVTFTKVSAAGSGGTFQFFIERPFSEVL